VCILPVELNRNWMNANFYFIYLFIAFISFNVIVYVYVAL
jgi:hypothetical protein